MGALRLEKRKELNQFIRKINGETLFKWRTEKKLSLRKAAKIIGLKDHMYLSRIEKGQVSISESVLTKAIHAYGLNAEDRNEIIQIEEMDFIFKDKELYQLLLEAKHSKKLPRLKECLRTLVKSK